MPDQLSAFSSQLSAFSLQPCRARRAQRGPPHSASRRICVHPRPSAVPFSFRLSAFSSPLSAFLAASAVPFLRFHLSAFGFPVSAFRFRQTAHMDATTQPQELYGLRPVHRAQRLMQRGLASPLPARTPKQRPGPRCMLRVANRRRVLVPRLSPLASTHHFGSNARTEGLGRAITCAAISLPSPSTCPLPASIAARTEATSPFTTMVT